MKPGSQGLAFQKRKNKDFMLLDFLGKFPGVGSAQLFLEALQAIEKSIPAGAKDYVIDQAIAYLQSLKGK